MVSPGSPALHGGVFGEFERCNGILCEELHHKLLGSAARVMDVCFSFLWRKIPRFQTNTFFHLHFLLSTEVVPTVEASAGSNTT